VSVVCVCVCICVCVCVCIRVCVKMYREKILPVEKDFSFGACVAVSV
jgi:hypothetical protein